MGQNTRIFNRWQGYSVADCDCRWCLHKGRKGRCKLPKCCCDDERREALECEKRATVSLVGAFEGGDVFPCRG